MAEDDGRRDFLKGAAIAAGAIALAAFGGPTPGEAQAITNPSSASTKKFGPENALDHVVVIMFENRSFDNVLGRLYEPGEVAAFEGVIGKNLSNPIPEWAEHGADKKTAPYTVAGTMNSPPWDPGEEYNSVNTQLFGIQDPENRGKLRGLKTYNAPPAGSRPTMDGFVTDYISTFMAEERRQPTYEQFAQIMTGYAPAQMPVLSGAARGFATFDHWFCEVPSCTFPNRSFFHAGTSSGFVVNYPPADAFPVHNTAETLFDRLDAAGLSWKVYCSPPSHYSLTGVIHAPRLRRKFATNFFSLEQFFEDARNGQLPTYAFIEPQIIGYDHNDMHPPFNMLLPGLTFDPPSSLLGGEALLAQVYNAIRSSSAATGSNWLNTTLLVTFDEHGGTYDHVPPPSAVPPHPGVAPGQLGFTFDRSGVRIPTLAISAWIPERVVVTEEYRATSLIATMRERWNLGPPLTARDASARSFANAGLFSLSKPRPPEDWPELVARPVPKGPASVFPLDAPLGLLGKSLFAGILALARDLGAKAPELDKDVPITGAQAQIICDEVARGLFPGLST